MPKTTARSPRSRPRARPRALVAGALAGAVALVGLAGALPASAAPTGAPSFSSVSDPSSGSGPSGAAPSSSGRPGSVTGSVTASVAVPTDFRDRPALPAGVDPAAWRCEVHAAAPRLSMGGLAVTLAPITMTHAEGPLPDGTPGQVWGAMHSAATPVPGGLTGTAQAGPAPLTGLSLQPEYGGRSDFYTGRFSLRFRLVSPLLPRSCVIGADAPVDFALKRPSPSEWLSTDPPVIRFSAYDDTFAAPAPGHCGPLTRILGRRLGLPAPTGNLMSYDAIYTFRTYDTLPAR
ncbi:hypothetical protein ACH4C2_15920 [Streptomyces sp. NPDC018057]|uniref:hypothetical protein n=1 Tax=unclassified Streptomyces TaxID=2593676 RepID=UPI00379FB5C9